MIQITLDNTGIFIFLTDSPEDRGIALQCTNDIRYILGIQDKAGRVKVYKTRTDKPLDEEICDKNVVFDSPYKDTCILDFKKINNDDNNTQTS